MTSKILYSPAKINLFLKVINQREDGYHNLQSLFTYIDLYDEIKVTLQKNSKNQIIVNNPSIDCPADEDLIFMACKKILPKNFSIEIDVKKNIPDGAGLGGGSSNAGTILIAINDLCNLNLSKKELANIGAHLGADVPFFIHNNSAIVEGIGDKITPIDLAPLKLLLCCPDLKISTKDIFTSYKLTNKSKELKITALSNYEDLIDELGNDLEAFVRQKNSTIDDLLSYLQKFGVAKLTGTGSGCFLILNETINLDEVKQNLPKNVRFYEVSSVNYNIAYNAQH